MIKVIIRGNWANTVGTDYCEALGIYNDLEDAWSDASDYAWDRWEADEDEDFADDGPDFYIEEYNPEEHDMLRAGGGSFKKDFSNDGLTTR